MGIWEAFGRLLRRRERSPLEKARAASKVLRRKGYEKRRRRPPRPDETASDIGATAYGMGADASCGMGGGGSY